MNVSVSRRISICYAINYNNEDHWLIFQPKYSSAIRFRFMFPFLLSLAAPFSWRSGKLGPCSWLLTSSGSGTPFLTQKLCKAKQLITTWQHFVRSKYSSPPKEKKCSDCNAYITNFVLSPSLTRPRVLGFILEFYGLNVLYIVSVGFESIRNLDSTCVRQNRKAKQ